jgi:hypothetical protein
VDCDRAGIVDLTRQPDGTLKRVLCSNLLKEVMALRDVGVARPAPALDGIPAPVLEPIAAGAAVGGQKLLHLTHGRCAHIASGPG